MPRRANKDGQVIAESSDKMWSTGEGNDKPLQHSCLKNPMNSMETGWHNSSINWVIFIREIYGLTVLKARLRSLE